VPAPININILQGDQSVFTRDISIGGNAYTEAVQKELDLPFESAEQLKKGIPVDGATFEEAQPVLRAVTENVLLEIQKTFDFFKATASLGSDRPDRAERRRVARRWIPRDGAGAVQRTRRGIRSIPRGDVGCEEAGR
jgi:Ethanolamine utilization protein EutJ (predicted chaperonin)